MGKISVKELFEQLLKVSIWGILPIFMLFTMVLCSMEFIDGVTYEKWLERNTEIKSRVDMLLKIFEAIIFYQSQGIIHGDIHAKNIMIDKNEAIHIIDFGTSSMDYYFSVVPGENERNPRLKKFRTKVHEIRSSASCSLGR